jgi:predicted ABC-type ATPase
VLVFIHMEQPALNQTRVHQRVSEDGHNVPPEIIRSRMPRAMKNVAAALPLVYEARLLDNASRATPFKEVALVRKGRRVRTAEPLPPWAEEMLRDIP